MLRTGINGSSDCPLRHSRTLSVTAFRLSGSLGIRSRCGFLRGRPVSRIHFWPRPAPQIGHPIDSAALGARRLKRGLYMYASAPFERNGVLNCSLSDSLPMLDCQGSRPTRVILTSTSAHCTFQEIFRCAWKGSSIRRPHINRWGGTRAQNNCGPNAAAVDHWFVHWAYDGRIHSHPIGACHRAWTRRVGSRKKSVEVDFRAAAPQFWLLMLFETRLPAHTAKTISRTIKMPIMGVRVSRRAGTVQHRRALARLHSSLPIRCEFAFQALTAGQVARNPLAPTIEALTGLCI